MVVFNYIFFHVLNILHKRNLPPLTIWSPKDKSQCQSFLFTYWFWYSHSLASWLLISIYLLTDLNIFEAWYLNSLTLNPRAQIVSLFYFGLWETLPIGFVSAWCTLIVLDSFFVFWYCRMFQALLVHSYMHTWKQTFL